MNPIFLPLTFLLGIAVGYLLWGTRVGSETAVQAAVQPAANQPAEPAAAETTPRQVTRYDVPVDDDPAFGPEDAPITIVEFSDYECPYCTKWHAEVLPRILADYPDQIRFVYRDFPLTTIHGNALSAAAAANCAGEQQAYWEFHNKLFVGESGLGNDAYQKYASELGLDMTEFDECVSSGRHEAEVMADLEWATKLGVRSTPTFFINGIALVGAQPYELFQEVIEKELAGEIP